MVTSDVAEEVIEKDNVKAQDKVKDNFFGFEHKRNQVRFGENLKKNFSSLRLD